MKSENYKMSVAIAAWSAGGDTVMFSM